MNQVCHPQPHPHFRWQCRTSSWNAHASAGEVFGIWRTVICSLIEVLPRYPRTGDQLLFRHLLSPSLHGFCCRYDEDGEEEAAPEPSPALHPPHPGTAAQPAPEPPADAPSQPMPEPPAGSAPGPADELPDEDDEFYDGAPTLPTHARSGRLFL